MIYAKHPVNDVFYPEHHNALRAQFLPIVVKLHCNRLDEGLL